jgi:Holliday junction resolvase RusA-like endonuclease
MTQRDKWANRPAVVKYHAFCDELRLAWSLQRDWKTVPEKITLIFYMPMSPSWSKKKSLMMDGQPHKQRPDIDNLVKAFLDALCEDDSYVWAIKAEKRWSSEPGIGVEEY